MADSYLTDTPYTWGYYAELNPAYLNYVCLLNGFAPRPLDRPFTYCDLGCGNGVTLAAQAQLFPEASFYGIDFNAEHIANASAIAEGGKLSNVKFIQADFSALDRNALPEFDFVVMHGVYSWIDPEARDRVREFVGAKVKPGGIVYVSYDCMPGWAALAPLREMMLQHTRALVSDSATKASAGLDYVRRLRDLKAGFFEDNPPLKVFIDEISAQDIRYVAHEFFGGAIKPYYFREVAGEMRSAGLHYAGSGVLNLNFIDLAAPADFRAMLAKSPSRLEYESTGDFVRNQRFRKDVFVKGGPSLSETDQSAALAEIPFGTVVDADSFKRVARFGDIELKYIAEVFELVIERTCAGAKTPKTLAADPELKRYGLDLILDAIRFLSAGGQLMPFLRPTQAPDKAALDAPRYQLAGAFNLSVLKARLLRQPGIALIGEDAGIGVEVAMADALFALCSVEAPRDQVAGWVSQRMREARTQLVFEGGSEVEAIEEALEKFRVHRLPKLIEFGVLKPAA
jgi:ubiquinone/menaquinone biosynthesis C-methylase UbiE